MADSRHTGVAKTLICLCDNVSVSVERVECLHPSSLCRFREFCEVIDAMRAAKRAEREATAEDSADGA
ncbi:MAG: hypothetical protein HQ567_01845 [Candidatus Nealsonbacteria bacterium]|nr:hypothetical protein [Candidatus Nealsonbacteria bacterium]